MSKIWSKWEGITTYMGDLHMRVNIKAPNNFVVGVQLLAVKQETLVAATYILQWLGFVGTGCQVMRLHNDQMGLVGDMVPLYGKACWHLYLSKKQAKALLDVSRIHLQKPASSGGTAMVYATEVMAKLLKVPIEDVDTASMKAKQQRAWARLTGQRDRYAWALQKIAQACAHQHATLVGEAPLPESMAARALAIRTLEGEG